MIAVNIKPIWPDGSIGEEIAKVSAPTYAGAMATAASRMARNGRAVMAAASIHGADPDAYPFNADNPPAYDLTVVST